MTSRLLASTALLALIVPTVTVPREPEALTPKVVLWAWERPVDLRGLPTAVGVAFLAQTVTVSATSHLTAPRRQPLRVDPSTYLVAVTRVEAPGEVPSDRAAIAAIAADIARTRMLPRVSAVQIDFDARESQRLMYRQLLHDVRSALPRWVPLSMTALASWCLDDYWLDDLPVDEVVPMFFRMGPSQALSQQQFRVKAEAACGRALGLSLDEPTGLRVRRLMRLYVFNPGPWTPASIAAAEQEATR